MAKFEFLDQDRFFLDLDNGTIEWMYHNPDPASEGQFVINVFDRALLEDAAKRPFEPEDSFDYIGSSCTQYLADRGTDFYGEAWQQMQSREPFAIGCTLTTLENLRLAFHAKDLLNRYCQKEFKTDAEFSDLRKIAIGYTTITDAKHDLQAYANLIDHRIEVYLNGNLAMHDQFDSLQEMVQFGLLELEFDDLYAVPDWVVADHERVAREDSLATRLVLFMKQYDPVYPDILEPGETDVDMIRKMKAEFKELDLIPPTIEEVEAVIKNRDLPAAEKTKLYDIMTDLYHMYADQMYVPVFDRETEVLRRAFTAFGLDGYQIHFDREGICVTKGGLEWHNEDIYAHLANVLTVEDCRKYREQVFPDYTDFVDLAAHNGIDIDARLRTPPAGRLDFLDTKGFVSESVEYQTEADFLQALKEEMHCGVPLVAVLYRDADGKTISRDFLNDLDTHPKGLVVEDATLAPLLVDRHDRGDAR